MREAFDGEFEYLRREGADEEISNELNAMGSVTKEDVARLEDESMNEEVGELFASMEQDNQRILESEKELRKALKQTIEICYQGHDFFEYGDTDELISLRALLDYIRNKGGVFAETMRPESVFHHNYEKLSAFIDSMEQLIKDHSVDPERPLSRALEALEKKRDKIKQDLKHAKALRELGEGGPSSSSGKKPAQGDAQKEGESDYTL